MQLECVGVHMHVYVTYERYQSRLARLYGFINGGFQLAVEGGARGVFAHWALGLFGVLCLRARGFWHHQVGVLNPTWQEPLADFTLTKHTP